ncbi:hypothetical protein BDK51DRAFT_46436 [Blyttiomyces helicus]|uniref:Uncharacterized protein n=1 Tax=Blyttiomyces helicus TaxID=388810 RepID=A0A4P9WHC3_9FUNG|nr:hypothetical protein BDK51DRAFT_46436 [Blyttiomyces helicus]|eukprot:RKO90808.1 hypothetical protein BDK51DRAFT_46436 [Blyttiomyces helicus]
MGGRSGAGTWPRATKTSRPGWSSSRPSRPGPGDRKAKQARAGTGAKGSRPSTGGKSGDGKGPRATKTSPPGLGDREAKRARAATGTEGAEIQKGNEVGQSLCEDGSTSACKHARAKLRSRKKRELGAPAARCLQAGAGSTVLKAERSATTGDCIYRQYCVLITPGHHGSRQSPAATSSEGSPEQTQLIGSGWGQRGKKTEFMLLPRSPVAESLPSLVSVIPHSCLSSLPRIVPGEFQPSNITAQLPSMTVLERLDFACSQMTEGGEDGAGELSGSNLVILVVDKKYPATFYCYRESGVHSPNAGPALTKNETFASGRPDVEGETASQVVCKVKTMFQESDRWDDCFWNHLLVSLFSSLVHSCISNSSLVVGLSIFSDIFLDHGFVLLTSSMNLLGAVVPVPQPPPDCILAAAPGVPATEAPGTAEFAEPPQPLQAVEAPTEGSEGASAFLVPRCAPVSLRSCRFKSSRPQWEPAASAVLWEHVYLPWDQEVLKFIESSHISARRLKDGVGRASIVGTLEICHSEPVTTAVVCEVLRSYPRLVALHAQAPEPGPTLCNDSSTFPAAITSGIARLEYLHIDGGTFSEPANAVYKMLIRSVGTPLAELEISSLDDRFDDAANVPQVPALPNFQIVNISRGAFSHLIARLSEIRPPLLRAGYPPLKSLRLGDSCGDELPQTSAALQRFLRTRGCNLETLDLGKNPQIDSELLACLATNTPRLESLDLSECSQVFRDTSLPLTVEQFSFLVDLRRGCPKLRRVCFEDPSEVPQEVKQFVAGMEIKIWDVSFMKSSPLWLDLKTISRYVWWPVGAGKGGKEGREMREKLQ